MNTPLLSIIVPAYNVADYINACVDSILSDSYPNKEIIVVDDGSTDQTAKLLRPYSDAGKIKLIEKSNGGLSETRNTGIKNASGEYITFIDSDDVIEKDSLDKNMSVIAANPDIDILQYPIRYFWTSDHEAIYLKDNDELIGNPKKIAELLITEYISASSCDKIYRKSLFDTVQFPVGRLYEDMHTQPFLFKQAHKIYLSNQGEYKYRYREGSTLNQTPSFRIVFDRLEARKQVMSLGIHNAVKTYRIHKALAKSYKETAADFKYLSDEERQKIFHSFNEIQGICKTDCIINFLSGKYNYSIFRICFLHTLQNIPAIFRYLLQE